MVGLTEHYFQFPGIEAWINGIVCELSDIIVWEYEIWINSREMYNGIGLPTPRGSGTNGYVQRNLAFVRKGKEKINYKTEEELEKLESQLTKQPNLEILDHERKRQLELKCLELEDIMEEQGWVQ